MAVSKIISSLISVFNFFRENSHNSLLNGENNESPTLMNVDVDPVLINQSPEPVQNAWEGDLTTNNDRSKCMLHSVCLMKSKSYSHKFCFTSKIANYCISRNH